MKTAIKSEVWWIQSHESLKLYDLTLKEADLMKDAASTVVQRWQTENPGKFIRVLKHPEWVDNGSDKPSNERPRNGRWYAFWVAVERPITRTHV